MLLSMAMVLLALQPAGSPPGKVVEAGTTDVSPLIRSMRVEPLDLRVDDQSAKVYELRVDSRLIGVQGDVMHARRTGNLTAYFPLSTYIATEQGTRATVPPGTVFWIGDPPATWGSSQPESLYGGDRADLSADFKWTGDQPETPDASAWRDAGAARRVGETRYVTIWTSEVIRRSRAEARLDQALSAR